MKPDKIFRVYLNAIRAMDDVNQFLEKNPSYKVSMIHSCTTNGSVYAMVVCTPVVK